LLARAHALRRRFMEHCAWEVAAPTVKDPDRIPDASTVRRWADGLDPSQPAACFRGQTLARLGHWLRRDDVADPQAEPWSRLIPILQVLWPLRL
jgi:hypothetical protein